MKILIFGLGYVGTVSGTLLSKLGNEVVIVELNAEKVAIFNSGKSPIYEPQLNEIISQQVNFGALRATSQPVRDLSETDVILISVGTPTNQANNQVDLTALNSVVDSIAKNIAKRTSPILIAVCSTVPPGTTENVVRKLLVESGVSQNNFVLGFIPEFLREGSAVLDFLEPSRFIIGANSIEEAGKFLKLRPDLSDRTYLISTQDAEMLKIVENGFHALKISFANEVGRLSRRIGADGNKVMELLTLDTRQNISKAYLRPGFAYGGSCLPKDLRSFQQLGLNHGVKLPLVDAIAVSNTNQIYESIDRIRNSKFQKIGILGLAFKADTDDIRESPSLAIIECLALEGHEIIVHDFGVNPLNLTGANLKRWQIFERIGVKFSNDLNFVISISELIVVTQHNKKYFQDKSVLEFRHVIDLTQNLSR